MPKARTGTRVRYWADRQIFLKDAKLSLETLRQRARQTALLVPGLTIVVRDERGLDGEGKSQEIFRFDGGISEFCEYLAPDRAVCDVVRLTGHGTFKETVPVLNDRGHMTPTEVTRKLGVDIALRWGTGYDTTVRSFVNIIPTPKGGTHITGFERSVTKTVYEVLRSAKLLRIAEDDIVHVDPCLRGCRTDLWGSKTCRCTSGHRRSPSCWAPPASPSTSTSPNRSGGRTALAEAEPAPAPPGSAGPAD